MSSKGQSFTYLLYLQICQITTKTFTLCKDFEKFIGHKNITGNFEKVRIALDHNEQLAMQIEDKMLRLPKQQYDAVMKIAKKVENEEELLKQFEKLWKNKTSNFPRKRRTRISRMGTRNTRTNT